MADHGAPKGFLVVGISPRRVLDADYRAFLGLAAEHIAATVAEARAFEGERRRAEALAELDRAKTAFFSNVSHEFRTPLTLMLGPLEELLGKPEGELPADGRALAAVAHRNGLRLLKLVNTLLDFSRIEAGRARASHEPMDLARSTAELASAFRSACERAGLSLDIACETLPEPVWVDRDMWEKVVFNLLSNAFKFTFEGGIAVRLAAAAAGAELRVGDTGVGIPGPELPRVFERFHRVEGQKSRSFEGSGIGLALVRELVRLHGGTIAVDSEAGRGTTFTVAVPFGTAHLPPGGPAARRPCPPPRPARRPTSRRRWGGCRATGARRGRRAATGRSRAAGKASGSCWRTTTPTCASTWRACCPPGVGGRGGRGRASGAGGRPPPQARPRAFRRDDAADGRIRAGCGPAGRPGHAGVPVIILSARAGEEARVGVWQRGADDYLVKPFSAVELVAKISSHLTLSRLRAAELAAMTRLHHLSARPTATSDLSSTLYEVLDAAMELLGAAFGDVQLYDEESATLSITAHRGVSEEFLEHFKMVDAGATSGRRLGSAFGWPRDRRGCRSGPTLRGAPRNSSRYGLSCRHRDAAVRQGQRQTAGHALDAVPATPSPICPRIAHDRPLCAPG